MKYKRIMSMIATGILMLNLVSCSSDNNENKDVAMESGEEVVVATSVAVTEILDALGVKVSGVPKTSYELPKSTEGAVEIGNPMSPDLEIIKSLNPTIVVSVDTLGSDYMNLFTENNIPSEFVSLESLDGLKEAITILGKKFDKNDEAKNLLNEIELKESEVKKKAETLENPEILVLFAAPGSTMIATSKSYIGSLVKIVGGKNIVEDNSTSFTTYNKEDLAMLNPEKILVMVHAMPEETKAALEKEMSTDSAWQNIKAVKEGNVVYLDSTYFGMSANLKVIEGLDILSDIVHGDGE
ncbi:MULTISPECIES: heme ABC transporter substrate-binding protein IsdE [unclassified Clostridium]|uniref:heme ABC transporter substrate-binding protein IsdE n=1 Tax=Clostridium TaxID=1485 RepID=UPI001C8C56E1|nr:MULTISPECIES: heme ABC transporter substrate-binding protein IsdE [unclassified Clostridium]MBX9138450.1 heme ABC transporter substrate-binding protein IsdE [Clostridium sp. K12(2020)]MBX9142850.1 heme ABC transporter substrate-binding protein IsdE [Clostridium sp. K13]MDU2289549.1 heme ABC transporter substrate-binding protein IsdE [Clostridium celatum]MDU4324618.1 heme ABC transporter substrate-binding protein IsdE [Clostridium celatum]